MRAETYWYRESGVWIRVRGSSAALLPRSPVAVEFAELAAIDTWESIALADRTLYRDALLAVRAFADRARAYGSSMVTFSRRALQDAMQEVRGGPVKRAHADKGLQALIGKGYLNRLNPDAARSTARQYRLTVPATSLVL